MNLPNAPAAGKATVPIADADPSRDAWTVLRCQHPRFRGSSARAATPVFINEIHCDNAGTDTGEAIEVAGPAGGSLSGRSPVLYNGNGGADHRTAPLSGTIPDQDGGFGTQSFGYPRTASRTARPTASPWSTRRAPSCDS